MERDLRQTNAAHGFIRGEIFFVDGCMLHLREFVDVEDGVDRFTYVYQYMDAGQSLVFRYDNTGHHKKLNLPTYPHHKHEGSEQIVVPSNAPDSYVSFEAALQHWGLHDQLPATVTSVALQQRGPVVIEGIRYRHVKTVEDYYFGWQTVEHSQRQARVAHPEKALVDLLQFHRSRLSLSLVVEKLAENCRQIDFDRLEAFLLRANLTTLRIGGYLLDQAGMDTTRLHERSDASTSVSRATPGSDTFAARWRLYIDPVMTSEPEPLRER